MTMEEPQINWMCALFIVAGMGLILLLTCTDIISRGRAVYRVLAMMWRSREQLYGMALMLSQTFVEGRQLPCGPPGEAPPPRRTKAEKKANRRGKRRTMRPPPME